jgi:hypothetical protein
VIASLLASACLFGSASALAEPPCSGIDHNCPLPLHSDTARGLALGTGVRASAVSTSALSYNPAALVLGKLYHIEGGVDYSSAYSGAALGAAVVDSATSQLGAGIAFRGFLAGDTGVNGIDGRAAIAFPFSEMISIGLGGRYLDLAYDTKDRSGRMTSTELVSGFTMDASLRVAPVPMLQLEALAANFINLDSPYTPVLLGGAAAFTAAQMVTIGLDTLVDVSSFDTAGVTIGGGVEVLLAEVAPIRLGYSFDTKRDLHTLSGGAGYTSRTVGVDFSIQQQLSRGADTRVMGVFRYYVH